MRGFVQFLTELVLALTGALAMGSLIVGGSAFALGCAACGCGYWWRGRRRRAAAERESD